MNRKEHNTDWEAVDAVIDEALAAVQSAENVEILHECRNRFKKRVPLLSRAYTAAVMALMLSGNMSAAKIRRKPIRQVSRSADSKEIAERQALPRFAGEGLTIFISAGRRQRMFPRIIVKMIASIPGVDPAMIGNIRIMDNYSFVVLEPSCVETVIAGLNGKMYKGRPLVVNHARKKDELTAESGMNYAQNEFQDTLDNSDTSEDNSDANEMTDSND